MPFVSVVIPLFNKERYIRRCIESVLCQTVQGFEILVVDDGSTDGGGAIAESLGDPRIRVFRQENRGVSAARNRGIAESSGDLVAFLDGDDEWLPQFLEAILDLYRQYPQSGILATGFRRRKPYEVDTETTLTHPKTGYTHLIANYLALAMEGNFITSSSASVPRTVLNQVGGFIEGEPFGEDRDLWLRIGLRYPIAYDVRVLAIYHSEAEGRACNGWPVSQLPPAAGTLGRALADGSIAGDRIRQAKAYMDLLRLQYSYWYLNLRDRNGCLRLLAEPYLTPRYRAEAALVRFALGFLPMRLVAAIRIKPARLLAAIKRRVTRSRSISRDVASSCAVMTRPAPARMASQDRAV
jgi:cellulose synthase/poly-beta-1,6-N-acetylglucosamine synthase-like glycosyltransferase